MITKISRQRRESFCRRARRRDATLHSLYAGRHNRSQHHQQIGADMPSTVTFNTKHIMSQNNNGYGKPSQPTVVSQTLAPGRIFEHASFSYPPVERPANNFEIYGLALGTCFLALLLGWILVIVTRETIDLFRNNANEPSQIMDPESGYTQEGQTPKESVSFLSNLGNVPSEAEELIKSVRRASVNVATGLKRDVGLFRRKADPTRHRVDEEAALAETGKEGTETKGPFLPRT
ncbi:hypothetical protein F4781DRAFT_169329 [Annulohypoxylon bovei var. microspora]|nr:hypothetical protein F4781DRAFT_169329 [Annulohypoxylon bovei var. microspora]